MAKFSNRRAYYHRKQIGLWIHCCGHIIIFCVFVGLCSCRRPTLQEDVHARAASSAQHDKSAREEATPDAVLPTRNQVTWDRVDDPSRDGWRTEVTAQSAIRVLDQLATLIARDRAMGDGIRGLATSTFRCRRLLPERLDLVFSEGGLRVERARSSRMQANASIPFEGQDGFVRAINDLRSASRYTSDRRCKFKLFQIDTSSGHARTKQLFTFSARTHSGTVTQNATWTIQWKCLESRPPQVDSITVDEFELVRNSSPAGTLFTDCTVSVLDRNRCFREQFLNGLNHWLDRIQDTRYFAPLGNPGLAIGDVNGDRLDDLYVCQEAGLPNRLFVQQADGKLRDVSESWHVNWLESSRGALLLDLDNDGDQDLAVSVIGGVVVASNDAGKRFRIRRLLPTDDDTMSLSGADYDNDGDIDLFVCVDYPNDYFGQTDNISVLGGASNRVYHDANNAGRNSLFRNDVLESDTWQFTDVTDEVGLNHNNRRFSLASSWEDFDNDGDQDLYVANDFGRNNLYRNLLSESGEARFEEMAAYAGVEDSASGMSVAWGDANRDGQMDLYVANMFSAAGERITEQATFKPEATETVRSRLRRFARGSSLFKNLGERRFQDVSIEAAVQVGRWAWGSNFVDVNNDGWQDLVVANGYITAGDHGDL